VTIFSPGCGFRNFYHSILLHKTEGPVQSLRHPVFFVMITAFEWKVSNVYLALGFLGDVQGEFDKFGALFERASLK